MASIIEKAALRHNLILIKLIQHRFNEIFPGKTLLVFYCQPLLIKIKIENVFGYWHGSANNHPSYIKVCQLFEDLKMFSLNRYKLYIHFMHFEDVLIHSSNLKGGNISNG